MRRGCVSSQQFAQVAKQPPQSCIQSSYSPQQTVLATATHELFRAENKNLRDGENRQSSPCID